MKIQGKVRWTISGRFAIESDLLSVAQKFRDLPAKKKPKVLIIELEMDAPYTVDSVPVKLKLAPKTKSCEGGVGVA